MPSAHAPSPAGTTDSLAFEITVRFPLRLEFTRHLFDPSNPLLGHLIAAEPREGVLCVADANLLAAQPGLAPQIEAALAALPVRAATHLVPVPGGEACKNDPGIVTGLHRAISDARLSRHSYMVAVGGGAVLDVAGFAAATAHRGIRLIRVPTTTLSQADAGVGVKNGINAFGKKNFVGTFAPPVAVVNDFALLEGLPPRELRAGYAEAVKVALIRDPAFFEQLEREADQLARFEPAPLEAVIRRSAEIHLRHIAAGGDPFETGSSRPLDFGHWSAHKLEQMSGWRIGHGDAVAFGVALDTLYSAALGWITERDAARVLRLLKHLGFPLAWPDNEPPGRAEMLLEGLEEFREHLGGRLCIPLLTGIGRMAETDTIDPDRMIACIRRLGDALPG